MTEQETKLIIFFVFLAIVVLLFTTFFLTNVFGNKKRQEKKLTKAELFEKLSQKEKLAKMRKSITNSKRDYAEKK